MSLHDAITGALPDLQAHAESLMTVTVQALARNTSAAIAPGDLRRSDRYVSLGEPCKAKVQGPRQPDDSQVAVGGAEATRLDSQLHLPIDAYVSAEGLAIKPGWRFKVTAVAPPADAALLDRTYEVVAVQPKSFATARRLDVVEV